MTRDQRRASVAGALVALALVACGDESAAPERAERVSGAYRVAARDFVMDIEPTCETGPCEVRVTFRPGDVEIGGEGSATYDGVHYVGSVDVHSGCQLGGLILPNTREIVPVGIEFQAVGSVDDGGEPVAARIEGVWTLLPGPEGEEGVEDPLCEELWEKAAFEAVRG